MQGHRRHQRPGDFVPRLEQGLGAASRPHQKTPTTGKGLPCLLDQLQSRASVVLCLVAALQCRIGGGARTFLRHLGQLRALVVLPGIHGRQPPGLRSVNSSRRTATHY